MSSYSIEAQVSHDAMSQASQPTTIAPLEAQLTGTSSGSWSLLSDASKDDRLDDDLCAGHGQEFARPYVLYRTKPDMVVPGIGVRCIIGVRLPCTKVPSVEYQTPSIKHLRPLIGELANSLVTEIGRRLNSRTETLPAHKDTRPVEEIDLPLPEGLACSETLVYCCVYFITMGPGSCDGFCKRALKKMFCKTDPPSAQGEVTQFFNNMKWKPVICNVMQEWSLRDDVKRALIVPQY